MEGRLQSRVEVVVDQTRVVLLKSSVRDVALSIAILICEEEKLAKKPNFGVLTQTVVGP